MTPAVLAERLTAQGLRAALTGGVTAAARRLLAIQAQDARGARLAIRARSAVDDAAAVDAALAQRSVVVSWLCRGTLHLVATEDFWWLHQLTTPPRRTGNARRLWQEGVEPAVAERAVALVERALVDEGPLTRIQLRERLSRAGVPVNGQALVHILFAATLRGVALRGPVVGREHAYALARDWVGPPEGAFDHTRALAELARRYLVGHAPASARDLARWAGLPLRDARAGLQAIEPILESRAGGLVALRSAPAPGLPPPRLLGPWDPLQVGWADRSFVNGEHDARVVSGGLFRPFALVDGRAVATWTIQGGRVQLGEPFVPLADDALASLEIDAAAVEGYLALGGSERA